MCMYIDVGSDGNNGGESVRETMVLTTKEVVSKT